MHADPAWQSLADRLPGLQGFIYGTNQDALVYTYDPTEQSATVQLAVVDGSLVPP